MVSVLDQTTADVGATVAELVRAIEAADSKGAMVVAVNNLATAQNVAAIPTLITVLGYNNPGAAVAAVNGLAALGSAAVPALLEQIDGYNYGARAWAIRALALIGDPRALPVLLETAKGDFALSVRRAAARGLGTIHWALLPHDQAATAQSDVLDVLTNATADPEWVVRYAAVAGLQTLAADLVEPAGQKPLILAALQRVFAQDETPAVQARARLALDTLESTR
ncbi:HEAT repeat domain-containing protein [Nodosilinea sp. LEGE 07298]|uniref:HEAT repeat domain-containing protein n=1 Tax=Nodosilinea sp. LEGE 07298 TaxID=2777970 RepID=UPI0018829DF6|nr:HEAT repeat domain-containing protein [Nodosilinea sp. LEGE 07298]MBE9110283.1 HEAT repeat domain-containing protein [Nodosilinea sp. LEGE 07298]